MAGFQALGRRYEVALQPLASLEARPGGGRRTSHARAVRRGRGLDAAAIARSFDRSPVLRQRASDPQRLALVTPATPGGRAFGVAVDTLATETVIAEGLRAADLAAARNAGASVVDEGLDGKVLLRTESVARAFAVVELLSRREVGSVSPNFLRRVVRPAGSPPARPWAHSRIRVGAAWKLTRGSSEVRVAVLDEGVDTRHEGLAAAVVAEKDFIGDKGASALPDGDDAHGTACAGIVLSRNTAFPGVAPDCSLLAARIAMGDGNGGWIFDDFATADAIDWAWRQGAAVLSNSWGGGAPSDAISRAFARARTQGRQGRGAVVVLAAGNDQGEIGFPADLPDYVTVGASTPKDERKTRTSSDGETWWGSSYGDTLHLLAPGVFIWTLDITGPAGYDPADTTRLFNGTSSATPHVAGAAALMLSANPRLSAATVRSVLGETARRVAGQSGWTRELGFGRLDVGRAVAAAKKLVTKRSRVPAAASRKPRTGRRPA
jgi:subtilisin family serine protease